METRLFKTKKLANEYIRENYPGASLRSASISEDSDINERDMPNLQWQGETPAYLVEDSEGNDVAIIGWWEEGEDNYELFVGGKSVATYDNSYDAREAYADALEDESYEDAPREVKLFCNGDIISE